MTTKRLPGDDCHDDISSITKPDAGGSTGQCDASFQHLSEAGRFINGLPVRSHSIRKSPAAMVTFTGLYVSKWRALIHVYNVRSTRTGMCACPLLRARKIWYDDGDILRQQSIVSISRLTLLHGGHPVRQIVLRDYHQIN